MKKQFLLINLLITTILFAQQTKNDSIKKNTTVLDEVRIIGYKTNTLPGSNTLISSEKLLKLNQPDLNKVLATVPGVNIRDEEGFGLRPNIGLRGTSVNRSSKITLMEDGILIAPAPYSDPSAYYFPTLQRMEGIEVLKGSSQIKNGPYTIGGVVNLLSSSIPNNFTALGQLTYGAFNTNQQRILIGNSSKNFDYVFDVNRYASDGFKILDSGGNTGFERRDIMGKIRFKTSEEAKIQQSLTVKFLNFTEDGNESYVGLTYNDFKENPYRRYAATQKDKLTIKNNLFSLTHKITPLKNLNINTVAYYTETFRDWSRVNSAGGVANAKIISDPITNSIAYNIFTGNANGNIEFNEAVRNFATKGLQTNVTYDFKTGMLNHNLQIGARYHEDKSDRINTSSTYTMTNGVMAQSSRSLLANKENQIRNAYAFSSYIQYEINYKGLTITPGVRYEDINLGISNYGNADNSRIGTNLLIGKNSLSVFLPGVGVSYMFNKEMNLFGGVHKGFSPPGTPSTTGDQAKIETAVNYELGFRINKNNFNAQLVGFYSDYANILGADTTAGGGAGTGDLFNGGEAIIKGIELGIEYNLASILNSNLNYRIPVGITYTLTDARFNNHFLNKGGDWGTNFQIKKNDLIPFISPNLLTTTLGFENKKFNISLLGRFVDDTRTKPGVDNKIYPSENNYTSVDIIKKYIFFDLSANYKFTKNLTVFTLINNILNNEAIVSNLPEVGYRPGLPFSSNLGVRWQL